LQFSFQVCFDMINFVEGLLASYSFGAMPNIDDRF
jgi:hypothetical protein